MLWNRFEELGGQRPRRHPAPLPHDRRRRGPRRGPRPRLGRGPDGPQRLVGRHRRRPRRGVADHVLHDRQGGPGVSDPYRPLLHFAPRRHWINDPNGLIHHDGRWHLFFQHNPHGDHWADMSWGHAVSTDLVTWDERPVAIRQDVDADGRPVEYVFSGSAVARRRRPGRGLHLGRPPDQPGRTRAPDPAPRAEHRRRRDLGQGPGQPGARPRLDRLPRPEGVPRPGDRWLMVAVEAVEQRVVLYASDDLHSWTLLSEFADPAVAAGPWECPDLFPLAVEGSAEVRWVLLVSVLARRPRRRQRDALVGRRLRRHDVRPRARRLARPRPRLLRRRHLERRARRPPGDDRLARATGPTPATRPPSAGAGR